MKRSLCLSCLLLLGGCAGFPFPPAPAPMTSPPCSEQAGGAAIWLAAVHDTHIQTPEQQLQTLENWEHAFQGNPDINNRVRLALLLATGADAVRDTRRAHRLLNGIDPLPVDSGDREMIALLQQWLDDQGQSSRKLDILWKQLTEQNRRIEELEQQLQALTTIEQNIQSRDTPNASEHER
jgi:hypothetical protein